MARYLEINQTMARRQNVKRKSSGPVLTLGWQDWIAASVIVVLVLMTALLSVWSSGRIVSIGYGISTDLADKQKLIDEKNGLELEIYQLKAPERLEVEARKYGFVKPSADQFISVGKKDDSKN